MKKIYKVALVGCGTIAPNHLYALTQLKNVSVVALCDTRRERAVRRAEDFSLDGAKIYDDYYEMLCAERLDAVHIATPHYLHAKMTLAALERDINVFLEKPMCISEEEIEELIEAEKRSKGIVCVCFQNRFTSAVKLAREVLEADGGAISAHFSLFWKRDKQYYIDSGWRGKRATEGGGVMINQAIHSLDMLTLFLGAPRSVCATVANHHLKGIIDVEDSCEGVITFDRGRANFYATTSSLGTDDTSLTLLSKNHRVVINLPNVVIDGSTTSFEGEAGYVGKRCYGNGHLALVDMFYEAIATGGASPVPLTEASFALKILLAAYKSQDTEILIK